MNLKESFRPKAHTSPIGFVNALRFRIRIFLDLQVISVYRHVKLFLKNSRGCLLDVGCGESPYRFLVNEKLVKYIGLDNIDAARFDYRRKDITVFDGKKIPFADGAFDYLLCTEVLEHVEDYQILADEIYRVLKHEGKALITVPWSARYHYIPYDYFRYSPTTLQNIFRKHTYVRILPRGTDVTSISSKVIVLFFRNLFPNKIWLYIFFPLWLTALPLLFFAIILGHLSLLMKCGSDLDPIGYTILLKK